MEQVDIRFQYTEREYVKAVQKYLLASGTVRKTDVVLAIIGVPCALLVFFLLSLKWLGVLLVIGTVWFSCVIGYLYWYGQVMKFRKTPKYKEEYHMVFSEEGILFETATLHSELKWDTYTALWESKECYYLVQTKQIYSILPKRAFAGDVEKTAFERMAEQGVKSPKRKIEA